MHKMENHVKFEADVNQVFLSLIQTRQEDCVEIHELIRLLSAAGTSLQLDRLIRVNKLLADFYTRT